MTIDVLHNILPLPEAPYEIGSDEAWVEVQRALEVALPSDYKQYIRTYGTGQVGGFLWPHNPFTESPYLNLITQTPKILGALRTIKGVWGDLMPSYPFFPEPGGLLPWGHTDNGDVLYWQTAGNADQWTIVVNEARGPKFEHFQQTMMSFLAKILSQQVVSEIFPDDFPDKNNIFQAYRQG